MKRLMTTSGILSLLVPGIALAQGAGIALIPQTGMIGECNFVTGDFSFECIPLYVGYIITLAFSLAGGFALFELIKGGYEYAFSGLQGMGLGPDKESAKKRIGNALIGLAVVVLAYLIIDTIVSVVFS